MLPRHGQCIQLSHTVLQPPLRNLANIVPILPSQDATRTFDVTLHFGWQGDCLDPAATADSKVLISCFHDDVVLRCNINYNRSRLFSSFTPCAVRLDGSELIDLVGPITAYWCTRATTDLLPLPCCRLKRIRCMPRLCSHVHVGKSPGWHAHP